MRGEEGFMLYLVGAGAWTPGAAFPLSDHAEVGEDGTVWARHPSQATCHCKTFPNCLVEWGLCWLATEATPLRIARNAETRLQFASVLPLGRTLTAISLLVWSVAFCFVPPDFLYASRVS